MMTMEEAKKEMPAKRSMADQKKLLNAEKARLSPWLKWVHEETADGKTLLEWKPIEGVLRNLVSKTSKFTDHAGNPKIVYPITIEIDNMEKTLDAPEILKDLLFEAGVEFGDKIRISKTGEMKETRYKVEKLV